MISEQRKLYFRTRYKADPVYRSAQRARAKRYQQETRNDPVAYARRLERERELYKLRVKKLRETRICLTCEKEFRTRYVRKLTCSDECSRLRNIFTNKLYYEKHKERIKIRVRKYNREYYQFL